MAKENTEKNDKKKPCPLIILIAICMLLMMAITSASAEGWGNYCGDNLTWTLDNVTLRISGVGNMKDYNFRATAVIGPAPWGFDSPISEIIVEPGVTGIGSYGFYRCSNVTKVEVPATLTYIGNDAFHNCSALTDVYFGGSREEWNTLVTAIAPGNDELLNAQLHVKEETDVSTLEGGDSVNEPEKDDYHDYEIPVINAEDGLSSEAGMLQNINTLSPYQSYFTKPAEYRINLKDTDGYKFSNHYVAYYNVVKKCIEQYGNTDIADGYNYGQQHFTGLSFLELVDFNSDGIEEMLLSFYVEEGIYVVNIWGYEEGKPVLLQDGHGFYGTNGSVQTVCIVYPANGSGPALLRGSADQFVYNYYYGFSGQNFGLLKYISDGEYGSSGCVIDGQNVSSEQLNEELRVFGTRDSAVERYCLCPYDSAEAGHTMEVINSTFQRLQQSAEESISIEEFANLFSVREEKGRTILSIELPIPENDYGTDYLLRINNLTTGETEKQRISLLKGAETNSIEFDFSTDLYLCSGRYSFELQEGYTDETIDVYFYIYDEERKTSDDDRNGNEREYRRLLSQADIDNISQEYQLLDNISTRLESAGLDWDTIELLLRCLRRSNSEFRKLYLYSFYKYRFGYKNGGTEFTLSDKTIKIGSIFNDSKSDKIYQLIHETGHAIDRIYGLTESDKDLYYELLKNDVINLIRTKLEYWAEKKRKTLTPQDLDAKNDGFLRHISEAVICSGIKTANLTKDEKEAYEFVLSEIAGDHGFWKFAEYQIGEVITNGNMLDVFDGMTNNKLAYCYSEFDDLTGKVVHGPIIGVKDYWYDEGGNIKKWRIVTEAFAEYYSAEFTENHNLTNLNRTLFGDACGKFDEDIPELLAFYSENL